MKAGDLIRLTYLRELLTDTEAGDLHYLLRLWKHSPDDMVTLPHLNGDLSNLMTSRERTALASFYGRCSMKAWNQLKTYQVSATDVFAMLRERGEDVPEQAVLIGASVVGGYRSSGWTGGTLKLLVRSPRECSQGE